MLFRIISIFSYTAILFFLSDQNSFPHEPFFPHEDKIVHIILYLPMGFLLAGFLNSIFFHSCINQNLTSSRLRILYYLYFFLGAIHLSVMDESHQFFVPGRNAEFLDMAADIIGCATGCYFYLKYSFFKNQKKLKKT